MSPENKLLSIPFIFRKINADFKETVLKTLDSIVSQLKEVHSAHVNRFPPDKEKFSGKYGKMLSEIDDLKQDFLQLLQSRAVFTEAGSDGLEAIRWHLHKCFQEISTLSELHAAEPKELYYLQILLRWSEFKTQFEIETTKTRNARYKYFGSSFTGLLFVLVPFLNLMSLTLGIYQLTRLDWRARLVGLITLVIFFIQATSVALVSWG